MNRWIIATVSLILSLVLTGCVTGDVRCHRLPDGHWGCEGGVGGSPPAGLALERIRVPPPYSIGFKLNPHVAHRA